MISANFENQLMLEADNRIGTLADITEIVSASGINLVAICAYAIGNKSFIMFVSENNIKAKQLLSEKGFNVREEQVVAVSLGNKPGALKKLSSAISNAGIDMTLLYGSVAQAGSSSRIVLISEDNQSVLTVIRMIK